MELRIGAERREVFRRRIGPARAVLEPGGSMGNWERSAISDRSSADGGMPNAGTHDRFSKGAVERKDIGQSVREKWRRRRGERGGWQAPEMDFLIELQGVGDLDD
jgi:hypothetical protein